MAAFECDSCGRCCKSFGKFITIERQLGPRDYYCRYGITNEIFPVHVQQEFADEIDEEFSDLVSREKLEATGCVFSRKKPGEPGCSCAIYPTRPKVCRDFRCYRMVIRDCRTREIRGKLMGTGELITHDENLAAIWAQEIAILPRTVSPLHDTDKKNEWVRIVTGILAGHGYLADPVV